MGLQQVVVIPFLHPLINAVQNQNLKTLFFYLRSTADFIDASASGINSTCCINSNQAALRSNINSKDEFRTIPVMVFEIEAALVDYFNKTDIQQEGYHVCSKEILLEFISSAKMKQYCANVCPN